MEVQILINLFLQNNVQLSLVSPRKGFNELEKLPAMVNNKKTEINIVSDTINPLHVVHLAGLKLPTPQATPAPTPPTSTASSVSAAPIIGKTTTIFIIAHGIFFEPSNMFLRSDKSSQVRELPRSIPNCDRHNPCK
jgi:hypothetical protein